MEKKKTKVYIYTRVSTAMQIDGYSLDAQRTRMRAFAEFNDYEVAGEYEDAGKSGKSIEGRDEFNRMMEDIKTGKDDVSFVLVFKLSRFGRNAADVLSTLQTMQDFGVNLICVEDGIDSSKDAGKLMISVLSAVAEIERENIRVQTMEGRIQKARDGKWNGGFPPNSGSPRISAPMVLPSIWKITGSIRLPVIMERIRCLIPHLFAVSSRTRCTAERSLMAAVKRKRCMAPATNTSWSSRMITW